MILNMCCYRHHGHRDRDLRGMCFPIKGGAEASLRVLAYLLSLVSCLSSLVSCLAPRLKTAPHLHYQPVTFASNLLASGQVIVVHGNQKVS